MSFVSLYIKGIIYIHLNWRNVRAKKAPPPYVHCICGQFFWQTEIASHYFNMHFVFLSTSHILWRMVIIYFDWQAATFFNGSVYKLLSTKTFYPQQQNLPFSAAINENGISKNGNMLDFFSHKRTNGEFSVSKLSEYKKSDNRREKT